jgi:predicted DCC family thiol-disulfide oxidoreductase YuxK
LPYLSSMATSLLADRPPNGWILYDGACGFCSHWVPRFSGTLKRLGLGIAPLQSTWVQERTGLAPDVLSTDLRLLHRDGRVTSGPDVYRYVMRRVWWAYPLFLLSRLPVVSRIFNLTYRVFARHRMQISSTCGLVPPSSGTGS